VHPKDESNSWWPPGYFRILVPGKKLLISELLVIIRILRVVTPKTRFSWDSKKKLKIENKFFFFPFAQSITDQGRPTFLLKSGDFLVDS
jgi:hypothetical protein